MPDARAVRARLRGRGFEWIDCDDADNSALSWLRRAENGDLVLVVSNFTPVPREGFRIGVPQGGGYRELLNTNAVDYGGSGLGNSGVIESTAIASHGKPQSIVVTLPPLATIILAPGATSEAVQ